MVVLDWRWGIALLLSAPLLGLAAAQGAAGQAPEGRPRIDDLAWLSGTSGTVGNQEFEEHWTDPAGDLMLAVSRTLAGGRVVSFEFLRIEARADGVFYVAQPRGRPGTDFRLTRLAGQSAVFENPSHDFPKRILYRLNPDGSLTARIDGGEGVARGAQEFHFRKKAR